MIQKTAILEVRKRLGIPDEGFPHEIEALAWYREHYRQAKGKDFTGTFGFRYDYSSGLVDFEYVTGPDSIKIYAPHPLDETVPLDKEATSLAGKFNLPDWAASVCRLVILVGELPEMLEPRMPSHLISPLEGIRVLIHPFEEKSLRDWRKTGQMMGIQKEKTNEIKPPWTTTTYSPKRENSNELLYWQTLCAYMDAIERRRLDGWKGKKGLLVDTARILVKKYGWHKMEDSYTIRRFLDRAEKIWHISTHEV